MAGVPLGRDRCSVVAARVPSGEDRMAMGGEGKLCLRVEFINVDGLSIFMKEGTL